MIRARDIIAALQAERIRQGISQRGMSARVGMSQAMVGQWERGWVGPSTRAVAVWHEALGLHPPLGLEKLFRRDPQDRPECRTRAGYERHRRRREYCLHCWSWWAAYMQVRRKLRAAKRAA